MSAIHRRDFFRSAMATGAVLAGGALLPRSARAALDRTARSDSRLFEIRTAIDIPLTLDGARLWLPLFDSAPDYQDRVKLDWTGNAADVRVIEDPVYGAPVLMARWDKGAERQTIDVVQLLATRDRTATGDGALADAVEREFWTRPSKAVPTDGIVAATAQGIVGDLTDPKLKARAIYDWIVANSYRDPAVEGCGPGDIKAMLESGNLGGKCADINGLMVGLCRAAGIPARDVYGIRLAPSDYYDAMGSSGDVSGAQHCRAEIHLDREGWFAVDPADVRKVVLQESLPVDSEPVRKLADHLFGNWEGNWGGFNNADTVEYPGATQATRYHFAMYPCAMSDDLQANCIDATNFAYRITSKEIMA